MAKPRQSSAPFRFAVPSTVDQSSRRGREDVYKEVFIDGSWSGIKVNLDMRGWPPLQIEQIHERLRQGWPLAVAISSVAIGFGRCPLRSKPFG